MIEDDGGAPPAVPEHTRCVFVLAQLSTLIDGECPERLCETLMCHLDECSECMSAFQLAARFKRLIATKCGGDMRPKR